MKKSSLLLLAAGLTSGGAAFAQSNVTIYGIVDTSIHYLSNANAQGNSNVRMDNGAIANSRVSAACASSKRCSSSKVIPALYKARPSPGLSRSTCSRLCNASSCRPNACNTPARLFQPSATCG